VNALGNVFSQACWKTGRGGADGALTKRNAARVFHPGPGSSRPFMAERALTGAKNIIQGPGVSIPFTGTGAPRFDGRGCEEIDGSAGKKFEVVNLSAKPYPCCRETHGAIDATLNLMRENKIQEKEVQG